MIRQKQYKEIPPRVNIIGVPISVVNMESCIQFLFNNWENAHGNYICISNVHTTVMAYEDKDYYEIQSRSLLSVPDGKPLSIIGKRQYSEMDRITGPDFMRRIFQESKNKRIKHFFYGTTRKNLDIFIKKIRNDYPWLDIVGYEPSVFREMSKDEEFELATRINNTNADIIWVALGAPRQEIFCHKNKGIIKGITVGVGGAFNVISGIIPEAPKWVQDLSLEWFFRLMQEPKRLIKRYAVTNTKFIYYLITKKQ